VLAGTLRAVFDRDEFPADPKTNWTYENSPNNDGAAPPNANNNQGTQTEVPEVPGGGGGEPRTEQPAQESGYTCFFPPDLQKKKEEDKANDSPGVVCALPLPPASAMLAPGSNPAEQGNTAQNNSNCGPSDDPCGPNYPDNKPWCTTHTDGNGDKPEEKKEKQDDKCAPHEVLVDGKCESKIRLAKEFCQGALGLTGEDAVECQKNVIKLIDEDGSFAAAARGVAAFIKKASDWITSIKNLTRNLRELAPFAGFKKMTKNLEEVPILKEIWDLQSKMETLAQKLSDGQGTAGDIFALGNAIAAVEEKMRVLKDYIDLMKNIGGIATGPLVQGFYKGTVRFQPQNKIEQVLLEAVESGGFEIKKGGRITIGKEEYSTTGMQNIGQGKGNLTIPELRDRADIAAVLQGYAGKLKIDPDKISKWTLDIYDSKSQIGAEVHWYEYADDNIKIKFALKFK
jgi:hypothetical protein